MPENEYYPIGAGGSGMPEEQAAFMRVAVTGVPGIESAPQLRTKHYICVDIESWPAIMKQS